MVRRCVEEGIANGKPFEFEARNVRRSSEERVVHSICYAEKDHDGVVVALFGVFSGITERREQELERLRTLDELFRSNTELSRFSYVCSHDMKEPVHTLGSMAELLIDEENPLDDDRIYVCSGIEDEAVTPPGMISEVPRPPQSSFSECFVAQFQHRLDEVGQD